MEKQKAEFIKKEKEQKKKKKKKKKKPPLFIRAAFRKINLRFNISRNEPSSHRISA